MYLVILGRSMPKIIIVGVKPSKATKIYYFVKKLSQSFIRIEQSLLKIYMVECSTNIN